MTTKRLGLLFVAVICFVLVSVTSFARPLTTECSEAFDANATRSWNDYQSCVAHAGGNFGYAMVCGTIYAEQMAIHLAVLEACNLQIIGG